jgi:hypothetical protein
MSTTTDLRTLAATVVRDADTDPAAFFMHLAELPTPAVTYTRFRDERIVEYLIYQDPTPLARAAGRRPSGTTA